MGAVALGRNGVERKGNVDLIIRNAGLLDRQGSWDVGIQGDRIASVEQHIAEQGDEEFDAAGRLVAPTYVNGHTHLDKCHLGDVMRPNETYSFQSVWPSLGSTSAPIPLTTSWSGAAVLFERAS